MKKKLLVGLLVCAILASVVTGTLAVYSASIDEMTGDVVAKSFVLDGKNDVNFKKGMSIAPSETLKFEFEVRNFKDNIVTETAMNVVTEFHFPNSNDKKNLEPLRATIARRVESLNGLTKSVYTPDHVYAGKSISYVDFLKQNEASTIFFTVTVEWMPILNVADIEFQGIAFGNDLVFTAKGTQIPDRA